VLHLPHDPGRRGRLLSGPGGLAAWLRARLAPGPAASVSLPLDIGTATDTIPAHLRRAVAVRDRGCRHMDPGELITTASTGP
jgi:hypothetical protein